MMAASFCVAVLADAGYLYGAGSTALAGSKQRQERLVLKIEETIAKLCETASQRVEDARLLRIYWYDGMRPQGPSPEQQRLASADNVKLRFGIVNRSGEQKGVDSLIVTDLIELARNHAISDAVLLSGDEDIRIGVQVAQSFGVRVHLLGIEPSRGNQSLLLRQEADTTSEWSKSDVAQILEFRPQNLQWTDDSTVPNAVSGDRQALLEEIVDEFLNSLNAEEFRAIAALGSVERVPKSLDGQLLGRGRAKAGEDLTEPEKRYARKILKEQAKARASTSRTS